ncbi:MAG TPA: phage tail length tape measure family protein [Burkholderiaceae bacterium]|nr:phage tail length tape measure family protein [Burkholderiaceae bacterium]HNG78209.1 phage tail length tape measure family protein [Burkholderiaceae bacterium]
MSNELVFKLRVDGAAVVGKDIASVGQSIDTLSASSPQAQAALAAATGQINTLGVSARQTAAAMRTLPAQFTDIATQLAGGQSPFLVLLQQGGQIKDSFGGIGNAAKALGSLLTPARVAFGGVAAAAGVLALAYNKGAEESKAYNAALINTGNAAGVTRDQLAGLAQSVGGVVGTQGQAADALAQLAATGKVAGAQLGLAAEAAIRLQRDAGQGVGETVKIFSELGKEPLQASIKLNESTNYLTISVLEQIRALEQQGKTAEAAALAQNTYATESIARTKELEANLGTLERAWRDAKEGAASFWDAALGIGRADTADKRIKELQGNLAQLAAAGQKDYLLFGSADKDRAELAGLQASKAAAEAEAKRKAEVAATTKAYIAATEANKKYTEMGLSGADKVNKALAEYRRNLATEQSGRASAGLPAITAAEIARVEKGIREQFAGPKGPAASTFFADLNRELDQQIKTIERRVEEGGNLTKAQELEIRLADKLQDASGKLTKAQLAGLQVKAREVVAAQERADAQALELKAAQQVANERAALRAAEEKGIEDFIAKEQAAREKAVTSVNDRVTALRDEEAAVAKARDLSISLAEAVELVAIARTEEAQSRLQPDSAAFADLQREIDARKELLGLLGTKAAREANDKAAKDALDTWQRTADQVGQSLTDALMQGGKSAWEYIKGLFRSTVLRPIIQGVVNPIAGAVTGALSLPGSAAAAGGLGGPLGGANNLLGSITGGLTSSIASLVSGAGNLLGSSALSTFATGMQGNALAAGLAGPTTAGAGGLLGAGASFASAVPYLAGALALFSAKDALFGRKLKDTSITGTLGGDAGFTGATEQFFKGGLFRSNKTETKALDATVSDPLAASVQAIKKTVADYAGALNLPVDQIASFTQAIKFSTKDLSPEQIQAKLQEALGSFGEALAGTFADQVAPFQTTGEKAGETLARLASSISGVNPLLEQLGLKVFDVGLAGADAASQLAAQLGGLEGLSQTSSAYFQAYYSEAERAAKATESITGVLGQVGLSLPATRDEFRKLVEAQDLTTEAGRESFAALLKVSGAFAELTPAAEASAQAVAESSKALREQLAGAIDSNIGKFLSPDQQTSRQYGQIASSLQAAGVDVNVEQLLGATKAQIFDFASAFVAAGENSDAAKLAVVNAAGSLADLKDAAAATAKELADQAAALAGELQQAVNANVDKFLTPRQQLERQAGGISSNLAAVGLSFSPEQLLSYSKDQIFDFAKSFVAATENSTEAKIAVVNAAGALADLSGALRDVKIDEFLAGLNVSADELLSAYRELTPASDNLVGAWRKARGEMEGLRDALAEIEGTKAVSALDQLRNTIAQRDALQGVIGGIDNTIGSIRGGTGDASALAYLKAREGELWKEFASTKNPAVAQAITDTTLQRIKLEGTLQQQANATQIDALRQQISAAERLRDVASQMGDFVLSLRAGSLSNLSASGRQAAQQKILDQAIATGGDVQGAAQALLQLGQQRFGGATAQYSQLFDQTQSQLLAFGATAAGADAQISDAQAQLNALTSVADNSMAQITALEGLRATFGAEVQTLDASVREQLAVQRSTLDQMIAMVTNQERQIQQLGEGLTKIIDGVERTADAAEGGALTGAEAEAAGVRP